VHLRIDSIEQALRNAGVQVEGEGYAVAYAIAEDNLRAGLTVIADCVNPWQLTRDTWRAVADRAGVRVLEVELACSDPIEHRRRVESRVPDLAGHRVPSWQEVLDRSYHAWDRDRLVLDTTRLSIDQSVKAIIARSC
jgi:predicted kinase